MGPLLFDGSVDIVAAFRVARGYYNGGVSRCLVQVGVESQSTYISTLKSMRAIAG